MEKVYQIQERELFLFLSLAEVKTKVNDAFRTVHPALPAYALAGAWKPWRGFCQLKPNHPTCSQDHCGLSQASQPSLWVSPEAHLCQLRSFLWGRRAGKPPRLMASAQWGLGEGLGTLRREGSWILDPKKLWKAEASGSRGGHTGLH